MVDGQSPALKWRVVELFLRGGSLIRLFKAHEGIELLSILLWRMELEAFNFSMGGEEVSKALLSHVLWETFNIEVASLLRALVLDGIAETLSLTVSLLKSLLDVKLLVVWKLISFKLGSVVKSVNSLGGASWSVFTVSLIIRVVADESIGSLIVAVKLKRLNASVLLEELAHLDLGPVGWEVLGIDVVVNFPELTLVLWLVLNSVAGV